MGKSNILDLDENGEFEFDIQSIKDTLIKDKRK